MEGFVVLIGIDIVIFSILVITRIMYRKEIGHLDKKQYQSKEMIGVGLFLFDYTTLFDSKIKVNQYIIELYGKPQYATKYRLYISQKISTIFIISYLIMILSTMVAYNNSQIHSIEFITRPEFGEGKKTEIISYELYGGSRILTNDVVMEIDERKPTDSQIQMALSNGAKEIYTKILGKNKSLDYVTTNLYLYKVDEKSHINIKWFTSDESIILDTGLIVSENLETSHEVILTALLTLENLEKIVEIPIVIYPKDITIREEMDEVVKEIYEFTNNEINNNTAKKLRLPTSYGKDIEVVWFNKGQATSVTTILVIGSLMIGVLLAGYDLGLKKQATKKREEILKEFPSFINTLVLLINAGMTFKGAWTKISEDYLKHKKRTGNKKFLYEEMLITNQNINNGMSNIQAYQDFGKRCQVPVVKRFSINITQNLIKGGNQLIEVLKDQRKESFDNRKNEARVAGEKASTKLLLPMAVMLVGIMIIVMSPIIISFNI